MDKKCIDVRRFIFTGTPGSGKTSVIMELEKRGHTVVHEAATDVIALQQGKGIKRPWEVPQFIDHITHMQKQRQMAATEERQFFDRSPFCTYALSCYLRQSPSPLLSDEIDRCLQNRLYHNTVFFFQNLGFIAHTPARKISYEEAVVFEHIHLDVYKNFGFQLVRVPVTSIEERCQFVLEMADMKKFNA